MAHAEIGRARDDLGRLFQAGTMLGLTERELLDRFLAHRDEAAFEAIVQRFGPMVLTVCRRLLHDPNDAEDAFQATFLVLVRKASTLRRGEQLGNWLYGVAYRVASRARVDAARRRRREEEAGARNVEPVSESTMDAELDAAPLVLEEVHRLPARYRVPVVLCYLEGCTHGEAAERLGWPLGSVKGRLARARELLQRRLGRRGLAVSAVAISAVLSTSTGRAALNPALVSSTVRAASVMAAGGVLASGVVPGSTLALVEGMTRTMFYSKATATLAGLLLCGGLVATGYSAWQANDGELGAAVVEARAASSPKDGSSDSAAEPVNQGPAERPKRALAPSSRSTGTAPAAAMMGMGSGGPTSPMAEGSGYGAMMGGGGRGNMQDGALAGYGRGMAMGMPGMMEGGSGGPGMMGEGMYGGSADEPDHESQFGFEQPSGFADLPNATERSLRVVETLHTTELNMPFDTETPLRDLLDYIQTATAEQQEAESILPIYVDPKALEELELTLDSPISINLENVPLRTSLWLVLRQLDLAYTVIDGVIIISTPEALVTMEQERPIFDATRAEQYRQTLAEEEERFQNQAGMAGPEGSAGGGFR